jgi:cell division protein ZapA
MSPSSDSIRVNIYGDEYSIKGDVDIDITKKVAQYVNLKMEEIQAGVPSREKLKIAVLSALNIAGELHDYKSKCEEYTKKLDQLQEKLGELNKKIDANVCAL